MQNLTQPQQQEFDRIWDKFQADLDKFECGPLGSAQYWTISVTYDWALSLLRADWFGFEKFKQLLNITHGPILTEAEVLERVSGTIEEAIAYAKEDPDHDYIERPINTIADYYACLKDEAWDLWSAAIPPLPELSIGENIKLPTFGPILNALAQSENFEIGVWLALTTYLFGTDISAFADFDT